MEQEELSEETYPFLLAREGIYQMVIDVKYYNGFYMEVYIISRSEETGFMWEVWTGPYKVLANERWARYMLP